MFTSVFSLAENEDYETIDKMRLVFDKERKEHILSIRTYDNAVFEGPKSFFVQLSILSGSRVQLTQSKIEVTILDDDTAFGKLSIFCVVHFGSFFSLEMRCHIDDNKCSDEGIVTTSIDTCCKDWKGKAISFSLANGICQPCISTYVYTYVKEGYFRSISDLHG